jgi:transketolase
MRTAFFKRLCELAEQQVAITLVVGDLGFGVVEQFAKRFPKQYLNAGVAEQNMTGIAAGLALSGKIVFTYSIANFPTIRCLEQIRNDVCYHRANVKVGAVGGGSCMGLGMTHHATEDSRFFALFQRWSSWLPAIPLRRNWRHGRSFRTQAPATQIGPRRRAARAYRSIPFQLGKAIMLSDGEDLTLISTGGMLSTAAQVAQILMGGISVRLLSMHTLKPIDDDAILSAVRETGQS